MKLTFVEPKGEATGCVVALPGRGMSGHVMVSFAEAMGLDALVLVVDPGDEGWYTPPFNPTDQDEAVEGSLISAKLVQSKLSILKHWGIKRIALVGYSAGGVVALQMALMSPYAAVVSIAGAILDPSLVPEPNGTPILLCHNEDDNVFDWKERYLPTKDALQKHNIYTSELLEGGHDLTSRHAWLAGEFVSKFLN